MIDDLDATLVAMLERELPPGIVSQVAITFATPDADFPPPSVKPPAIDLFLYDLRENRELRETEWIVERSGDGTATRQRPAVRVDCSYLVTAWPSENSNTPAQDEHRLLGEVMLVLLRYPTIPDGFLQGVLSGQDPPLPTTSLQPGRLPDVPAFWQALGGKPKAALSYTVTVSAVVEPPVEAEAPVVDRRLRLRLGIDRE